MSSNARMFCAGIYGSADPAHAEDLAHVISDQALEMAAAPEPAELARAKYVCLYRALWDGASLIAPCTHAMIQEPTQIFHLHAS